MGDSHFSVDTRRLGTFICEHFPSSFFYYGVCSTFIVDLGIGYTFFHLDSQWNTYIYNRQAGMAYRCQQYNLFTRLLSVLQWHSPQTRSFSSPVIACHLSIWQPGMDMFPQFASSTTSWEGHLGGAAAGIAAVYCSDTKALNNRNFS